MKKVLSLFAFLFLIHTPQMTRAAVFNPMDVASLIAAINTANANGDPSNTIELNSNGLYTLTAVDNVTSGSSGLPAITSANLIINGNGSTLTRDNAAPSFRFFYVPSTGSLELNDLTMSNGNSGAFSGGAISINAGEVTLHAVTLSNNLAPAGGAILNNGGMLSIVDSTLSGNMTTSGSNSGGAILIFQSGSMTEISNSTIDDNHATAGGAGAIYAEGPLEISNSTISRNTANGQGGAIWGGGSGIVWNLTNSTVSGNTAGSSGGAFYIDSATLNLSNTTITQNRALTGDAGGIHSVNGGNVVTLRNTILAQNFDDDDNGTPDCWALGGSAVISAGFNILGNNSGCVFTGTDGVNGDQVGTGATPIDALLGPLDFNGGDTETHNLQGGSPARDAGNDVVGCQDQNAAPLTMDQRFFPRPATVGGRCDIGAYEAAPGTAELSTMNLDFGDQTVGLPSSVQSIVLTNNGTDILAISSIDITGPFSVTDDCGGSLAPGESCTLDVVFQPDAIGAAAGTITLQDNAADSPQVITLTGNGVSTGPIPTPTPTSIPIAGEISGGGCFLNSGFSLASTTGSVVLWSLLFGFGMAWRRKR